MASRFLNLSLHFNPLIKPPSQSKLFFSVSSSSSRTFSVSSKMASTTKKVLFPIAHGNEPMEAIMTIDILRRAGADVVVASVEKDLVIKMTWGMKLVADAFITDCADTTFDLITLPGGLPGSETLRDCKILENLVKKQAEDGRHYAAICAAPAVALLPWGVLKGKEATCFPRFSEKLSSQATVVESRVHHHGQLVTSRSPGTGMEFSVALVEKLYGKEKYDEVANPLILRHNDGEEYTVTELNPVKWTFENAPQVLVPVANGTEEIEASAIIDILRRGKANVIVASLEDKLEIVASRNVKIVADMLLDEAAELSYDLIVLPGGLPGAQAFANSKKLVNLLKKQVESNKPYGAICASPALVLEPHGLLKGKKATAYPAMCDKLSDKSEIEHRVLIDGNLITSRGPGTSMEFAFAIVEKFFGRDKAMEIAKGILFVNP